MKYLILLSAMLLNTAVWAAPPIPSPTSPSAYQPYLNILPVLRHHARIPLLLPPAKQVQHYIFNQKIQPESIAILKPNAYLIYFEWVPGCHGGSACTQGALFAAKRNQRMPFNPSQSTNNTTPKQITSVELSQHIQGELNFNNQQVLQQLQPHASNKRSPALTFTSADSGSASPQPITSTTHTTTDAPKEKTLKINYPSSAYRFNSLSFDYNHTHYTLTLRNATAETFINIANAMIDYGPWNLTGATPPTSP